MFGDAMSRGEKKKKKKKEKRKRTRKLNGLGGREYI